MVYRYPLSSIQHPLEDPGRCSNFWMFSTSTLRELSLSCCFVAGGLFLTAGCGNPFPPVDFVCFRVFSGIWGLQIWFKNVAGDFEGFFSMKVPLFGLVMQWALLERCPKISRNHGQDQCGSLMAMAKYGNGWWKHHYCTLNTYMYINSVIHYICIHRYVYKYDTD